MTKARADTRDELRVHKQQPVGKVSRSHLLVQRSRLDLALFRSARRGFLCIFCASVRLTIFPCFCIGTIRHDASIAIDATHLKGGSWPNQATASEASKPPWTCNDLYGFVGYVLDFKMRTT